LMVKLTIIADFNAVLCYSFATKVAAALGGVMSISVRIEDELYAQAKAQATAEHRSIAGQIEYWAKVGRAALDNPDLPVSFIAESLISMAESREEALPFVPRSHSV